MDLKAPYGLGKQPNPLLNVSKIKVNSIKNKKYLKYNMNLQS